MDEEHHANHGSHDNHSHNDGHGSHDHHDDGDMVEDFEKRFYISLIITSPIVIMSPMIQSFMGVDWRFPSDQYILSILPTFIFVYGGWPFITGAIDELKDKNPGMM